MAYITWYKCLVLFCDEINLPDLVKYGKFVILCIIVYSDIVYYYWTLQGKP